MRKTGLTAFALTLLLSGAAFADTDIRFTLGWKTQGSDLSLIHI